MKARQYAYNVLKRIMKENGYASMILRHRKEEFIEEDVALISEIVYGTVRTYTYLTYQWKEFVNVPVKKDTEILLNMSVYQLLYLDRIPQYAILDEANDLASNKDRKFVNAILRKVIRRGPIEPNTGNKIEDLAIRYNHPSWLLHLWKAHYGYETMVKIVEADQRRGSVTGRLNTLKIEKEEVEKDERFHFIDEIAFVYDGNLVEHPYFEEGKVLIQDYSSQQVAKQTLVKPSMKVLDVCAAPGTKTQQLAMYMNNEGSVIACDYYEDRTRYIDELMEKTGVRIVKTMEQDATVNNPQIEPASMDVVLCDVPCSGLGDLAHKPEIRFHVTPDGLDEIMRIQTSILEQSSSYVKKGGTLVYSTCTLNKKENEKQVENFLKKHDDFTLVTSRTIFPFEYESDGFYYARLQRK